MAKYKILEIIEDFINEKVSYEVVKDFYLNLTKEEKEKFFNEIDKKIVSYKNLQETYKLIMNSLYGYTGFKSSPFYNKNIAEAITQTGATLLQMTMEFIEKYGIKVLYGDTDSMFITFKDLVEKENTHFSTKREFVNFVLNILNNTIYPELNKFLKQYVVDRVYLSNKKLEEDIEGFDFKTEMIADKIIFLRGKDKNVVKKKYIIDVSYNEGIYYDNGKLDFRGIDVRKGDISKEIKSLMLKVIKEIISEYEKGIDKCDVDKIINIHNENIKTIETWIDNFNFEKFAEIKNVSKSVNDYKNNNIQKQAIDLYNTFAEIYDLYKITGFVKVYLIYVKPNLTKIIVNKNLFDKVKNIVKNIKVIAIPTDFNIPVKILNEIFTYITIDKEETIKKVYTSRIEKLIETFIIDVKEEKRK